jgi:DNA-binding NarL/FixJ family response regulator
MVATDLNVECVASRRGADSGGTQPACEPRSAVRAVIAEDSLLLRAAAVRLLVDAGIDVVAEAGDGDELVRKVRAHRPDVAIIDIRMPPEQLDEGVQAARAIRAELPDVGLLLLSHYVEERYATELLEHGAHGVGYLLKERVADIAHFVDAVHQVAEGRLVLDPEVVAHMIGRHRRTQALDALKDREREVLGHMAAGASNHAIAERMFLSERAIERSVTSIFEALKLTASRHAHRRVLAVLAYLRAT